MIKKKIISFSLLLIIFFNINFLNATIENKILAKVENQLVSSFELKNKIKLILFLTNQKMDQANINSSKRNALEALISLKLKKEEVLRFKESIKSNSRTSSHLANLASKYNTDINGLKKIFKSNDVDFNFYLEEVKIEIAWQKLIFNIYNDKVVINELEIEKELKLTIENKDNVKSFNLSEIEIMLNEESTEKKIQEIMDQINDIGFENTAIKFSTAATSLDGGNIGWVDSRSLSKEIFKKVNTLTIGQISEPIIQGNSFFIIKLVDKKTNLNNNLDVEKLKESIVATKKNNLLNLYSNNHMSKLRNNAFIEIK